MTNAIEVSNLKKSYQNFTLNDVSFTLPMGSALGLIGENGAGKSTTISLLLDLSDCDGGEVRILGTDNTSDDFILTREDIGTVFDESCFPDGITAEKVDKIERCIFKNWDSKAFFTHIDAYNLPRKQMFKSFSRGMKMKLSLAVALSHGAKLLLLDEATGGLDPLARDELIEELEKLIADGEHAILLSSHIVSDIEKLCDRIVYLHKGSVLINEEKQVLLAAHEGENLEEIILKIAREERNK